MRTPLTVASPFGAERIVWQHNQHLSPGKWPALRWGTARRRAYTRVVRGSFAPALDLQTCSRCPLLGTAPGSVLQLRGTSLYRSAGDKCVVPTRSVHICMITIAHWRV